MAFPSSPATDDTYESASGTEYIYTALGTWVVNGTTQNASTIKSSYESNANTNVYTDAAVTKLSGIEAGAEVTDATKVGAAGAVMNADTTTAAMSFVIDEDTMATDSATKVPTQQSVKAYVDAAGGLSFPTPAAANLWTNKYSHTAGMVTQVAHTAPASPTGNTGRWMITRLVSFALLNASTSTSADFAGTPPSAVGWSHGFGFLSPGDTISIQPNPFDAGYSEIDAYWIE